MTGLRPWRKAEASENVKEVEKAESNFALDSTLWSTQPGSQIEGPTPHFYVPEQLSKRNNDTKNIDCCLEVHSLLSMLNRC